ncbi:hypothetical protein BH11ARM2_BH11ARM2_17300 [soil metagenome]
MQALFYLTGCLIWLPLCVWMVSLVQWMVSGETDVATGLIGIVVGLAMGAVAVTTPNLALRPFLFLAVLVTIIMYPFLRQAMIGRELKAIDVENMERSYQAIEERPDNAIAKLSLAKRAYALGYLNPAIGIAEEALNQLPKGVFEGDQKMVKRWKEYARRDPRAKVTLACPRCGNVNPPAATHCMKCGSRYLLDRSKVRFGPSVQGRKLLAGWIGMVLAIVGIPMASSLPPMLALVAIFGILAVVGVVLLLAFRSHEATA